MILEVIVQNAADARAATDGGADRLEVVRAIGDGGLTPLLETVEAIRAETSLPLRVMVRENAGFELQPGELPELRRSAAACAAMGVDGLVIGFARRGVPLVGELQQVLDGVPAARITFHRAFDALDDPLAAIPTLTAIPAIDRILTSGGTGNAEARCARLTEYVRAAGPRVTIIAGGGVDEASVSLFARRGCVREMHVGRAAREGGVADGPVSAGRVRFLKRLIAASSP